MGCSATKNVKVEDQYSTNGKLLVQNGKSVKKENGKPLENEETRTPPLQTDTPPVEEHETPVLNNLQKKESGLSFDLEFEEDKEQSIIKKHPPKRLQQLGPRQSSPVTLEKLQQKLEEAEIRREQIMAQRIYSAKQRNGTKRLSSGYSSNTEFPDYLKIPGEEKMRHE